MNPNLTVIEILDYFRFQVKEMYLSFNNHHNLSKVNKDVGWIISPQPVGDFKRLACTVNVNKVAIICYQRTRWKTALLFGYPIGYPILYCRCSTMYYEISTYLSRKRAGLFIFFIFLAFPSRESWTTSQPYLDQSLSTSPNVYIPVTWASLGMGSANERRRYIVTSSLRGWDHTQN